jgi:hypothetical protein
LDAALRARGLGRVDGGGAGLGWQEVFVVVDRGRWHAAWDVVRDTLAAQGVLGRSGLRATLYGPPAVQYLCPVPLGVWRVERLTHVELTHLTCQLQPLVDGARLNHRYALDHASDQAVQDTAAEASRALLELFDAMLTAWRAIFAE